MSTESHNRLAPEILKRMIGESDGESDALVLLESVVLGFMLYYRPDVRQASEFLDVLTERVIGRMK